MVAMNSQRLLCADRLSVPKVRFSCGAFCSDATTVCREVGVQPRASLTAVATDFAHASEASAGGVAVVGSSDGLVTLWDFDDSARLLCVGVREAHADGVRAIAVGGQPMEVVTGGRDGTVRLWNSRMLCRGTLECHDGDVLAISADFEARRVATGGGDGAVKVWDLDTMECIMAFLGQHVDQITAVSMSCPFWKLATCGVDGRLSVWSLDPECPRGKAGCIGAVIHPCPILAAAVDFGANRALVGCHEGTLVLWDLNLDSQTTEGPKTDEMAELEAVATAREHNKVVRCVAANFVLGTAVTGSYDATLKVWDLPALTIRATLRGHEGWVLTVAVNWKDKTALTGSTDGQLRLWDLENCEPQSATFALVGLEDAHEISLI